MAKKKQTDENNLISSLSNTLTIGHFASLSILDIITLQVLMHQPEPIIRYNLYTQVNHRIHPEEHENISETEIIFQESLKESKEVTPVEKLLSFLTTEKGKTIPTGGFYNNLKNLEKKGFVKFNYDKKGKIDTVKATPVTLLLLETIFRDVIRRVALTISKLTNKAPKLVVDQVKVKEFNLALTFNPDENILADHIQQLKNTTNEVFVLVKEDRSDVIENMNFENVKVSHFYKERRMMREANNMFDLGIISSYARNFNFYDLTRVDLLKEFVRVVKPGGIVVVFTLSKFPKTENIIINSVIEIILDAFKDLIFSKAEVIEEMKAGGLVNLNIVESEGLLIGIGYVPE